MKFSLVIIKYPLIFLHFTEPSQRTSSVNVVHVDKGFVRQPGSHQYIDEVTPKQGFDRQPVSHQYFDEVRPTQGLMRRSVSHPYIDEVRPKQGLVRHCDDGLYSKDKFLMRG